MPRLVLCRGLQESVRIGQDVLVTVVAVSGKRAKLLIEAPRNVRILREELNDKGAALCENGRSPGRSPKPKPGKPQEHSAAMLSEIAEPSD